jgi:hypothetical protein
MVAGNSQLGAVADLNPATVFLRAEELMDYQAFTNESLIMMYEGIRGALASDDAREGLGEEPRFRVRTTPEWRRHAGNLESEMLNRGMVVNVIDWSEDQATLPFEEGS